MMIEVIFEIWLGEWFYIKIFFWVIIEFFVRGCNLMKDFKLVCIILINVNIFYDFILDLFFVN